jgi:hypothetical protein
VRPSPVGVPLLGSRGRVDSVVLRQSPWRWSAAVSLVTLLAPWVLLTDWVWPVEPGDEPWRWWETAGVFAMGLYLGTLGLTFARTRVVLDRTGVHLRGGWLTRTVPWHETLGARVWDDDVLLLLGLDDEGDPDVVGGRVPRDLRADAVAAAAERWRLDAGPKGVRWQRPDPLLAGIAVVYAAAAVATVAGGYVT